MGSEMCIRDRSMAIPYVAIPIGCIYLIMNMLASDFERRLADGKEKAE